MSEGEAQGTRHSSAWAASVVYERQGQSGQCLHAGLLCFRHPRDERPVMVMAPLPDYFLEVLEKLERMG